MSHALRVLHIITGLETGGAERALFNLLSGGLRERFHNLVLSLSDEGVFGPRLRELGVPVVRLGMRRGWPSPAAVFRLYRQVRGFRPDVIQGWMYHGNLAGALGQTFFARRAALVWNVRQTLYELKHEKPMTRHVIRLNRMLSGRPHAIVYNSRLARAQHEAFGFRGAAGRVIPNGFDLRSWSPSTSRGQALRRSLEIPAAAFVVGHIARLHPMKDHEGFLRAAVSLARRQAAVHIVLGGREVVAGNTRLAGLVPEGMRERFHFLGERGDVPELMQAMDALCSSSSWGEAFPNVLGEAMATGVPCVATDVGDCADIVGDTGLIVPPRDAAALASALECMMTMPESRRKALGAAARARVEARYALVAVVGQYTAMYDELMAERETRA